MDKGISKNSRQVYFHMDLNPHNVIIKDDVPYVVDPDQFSWGDKTLFITRMQKHYFQFLEYVVYKI
jgi:RIO-like serine/threonine protein kinase